MSIFVSRWELVGNAEIDVFLCLNFSIEVGLGLKNANSAKSVRTMTSKLSLKLYHAGTPNMTAVYLQ